MRTRTRRFKHPGAVGTTPLVSQGIWVTTALQIFGRTRQWHHQSAKLHTLGYSFETHLLKAGSDIQILHHLPSHANLDYGHI